MSRGDERFDHEAFGEEPGETDFARLGAFVLALRAKGIHDMRVLGAIETTPRRLFLPAASQGQDYDDRALGIECGQTISAPSLVGLMLQAAYLGPEQRVLDIGTGSGYSAAVAARLVAQVYTVDRYKTLIDLARDRFAALRLRNIVSECRDGLNGWSEQAPFDRIIVSASVPEIPEALVAQLAPAGVLIAPVGPPGAPQILTRVRMGTAGEPPQLDMLAEVRFVPLVPGRAGQL